MSDQVWNRCRSITKELIDQPLNIYFSKPVDPDKENLVGYDEKVSRKMDLDTIRQNLSKNEYKTPQEWYNDVCLVYDNAMAYHKSESIWYKIADYNKRIFLKKASGMIFNDVKEWYDKVTLKMEKLSKKISNAPIPQGIDPLLPSVIKRSELMAPPSDSKVPDLVEKLNRAVLDPIIKKDVVFILKELEPQVNLEDETTEIDADKLSPHSLNAIQLYLDARG